MANKFPVNIMAMTGLAMLLLYLPVIEASEDLINFPVSQCAKPEKTIKILNNEYEKILKRNQETAKLYTLKSNETLRDITETLLKHPNTSEKTKESIKNKVKYYVFSYPSDGLKIKGYISFPADMKEPLPLIILSSGGNRLFGLPHPGGLSTQAGYAVIMMTNRGGVSEGKDQFGGDDVNDVKNLVKFLPTLEEKLNIHFHATDKYLVGISRGSMELFLALGRYPELQEKIKKIVSISGLLNLELAVKDRSDFRGMLTDSFGLSKGKQAKAWVAKRQPLNYAAALSKKVEVMIVQGTQDTRVCLKEGYDMLQTLHNAGHDVTYVEVEEGNHGIGNTPDFLRLLLDWLNQH